MIGSMIYGQNDQGEAVVVHLHQPRIIMRVVEVDEAGEPLHPDEDADVLSGITWSGEYDGGWFMLCAGAKLDDDGDFDLAAAIRALAGFAAMHLEVERAGQGMGADDE